MPDLTPEEPTQMDRVRAARALLVDARKHERPDQNEEETAAFMAIFHPDHQLSAGERYTDA
jgi:hypothetical protein